MNFLNDIKRWLVSATEIGLLLIAVGVVFGILFGPGMPFMGANIVGNLMAVIGDLGSNGLVGLISLGVILYLFEKRSTV